MRSLTSWILFPFLRVTGFRFSSEYRHGATAWKRFIYRMVDTVGSNAKAEGIF